MGFAQTPPDFYHSPGGLFDQTFDRFGKSYTLSQIHIPSTNVVSIETIEKFVIHFENGSGMEDPSNNLHINRKDVLITVLKDIEQFLILPNANDKVNIWMRDIGLANSTANQVLSMGSSVYNVTPTTTGTIADGEVWKTLLSGINSYTNTVNMPSNYYHGIMAFNFSTFNGNPVKWHTDYLTTVPSGHYDLYTAMLKEVMHLLGVTSLMNAYGNSVFGTNYKYYSRYDTKLNNNANTHSLLKNLGSISMYDWSFNTSLSPSILRPGCVLPDFTNPNASDNTTCAHAIKYNGSVTMPLFTPVCFEVGLSLSRFEDQRYPNCSTPYGNNAYFVMSNRNNKASIKRYPKPEERLVLADLGYQLNKEYGVNGAFNSYFEYDTLNDPDPQEVIGVDDGISEEGTYLFYGEVNQPITFSGAQILGNDINAVSFEFLPLLDPSFTLSVFSGDNTTSITFSSSVTGEVSLQYIPYDINHIPGNVTTLYFKIFGLIINNCSELNNCELVFKGDFEQFYEEQSVLQTYAKFCNWHNFGVGTPDYHHEQYPVAIIGLGVPYNSYGVQNDKIPGNQAYAGFWRTSGNGIGERIRTQLLEPLEQGKTYRLTFDVSRGDNWANSSNINYTATFKMQAFLASASVLDISAADLSPVFQPFGLFLENETFTETFTDWETITFEFLANGGEEFLFLGQVFLSNDIGNINPIIENEDYLAYYYLDNVSLSELENVTEVVDDSFTFSQSTNSQTSAISVLNNDHSGGQPFSPPPFNGVIITQLSTTSPNISINATGHVVVVANTPNGTYTLTYSFTSACSESDIATVTVVVSDTDVVFDVAEKYRQMDKCFENDVSFFNFNFFNPQNWDGIGFLINSLPLNNSLATVEVFGNPLPSGLSLNPNGIMTILENYYDEVEFYIIFRSTQNPSVTSLPIRCNFTIRPFGIAGSDVRVYNLHTQSFFGVSLISTSNNLLINDVITDCPNPEINFEQATSLNCIVEVTNNDNALHFNISQTGILSVFGVPNVTQINDPPYIVRYRICHLTTPGICSEEVEVWIGVIDLE